MPMMGVQEEIFYGRMAFAGSISVLEGGGSIVHIDR